MAITKVHNYFTYQQDVLYLSVKPTKSALFHKNISLITYLFLKTIMKTHIIRQAPPIATPTIIPVFLSSAKKKE